MGCNNIDALLPGFDDIFSDLFEGRDDRMNEIYEDAKDRARRAYANVVDDEEREALVEKAGVDATRDDFLILYDILSRRMRSMFGRNIKAKVWREIEVPSFDGFVDCIADFSPDRCKERGIGIFWAWDVEHAEAVDSEHGCPEGGELAVIEAVVGVDDVDFRETYIANAVYNLSENEIRLKPDRPILVTRVCKRVESSRRSRLSDCRVVNKVVLT